MKLKNTAKITILIWVSLLLSWGIPTLVRMATVTGQSYPFVYYSSLLQDFCITDLSENKKLSVHDRQGNEYTREQYDSLTPLFNYRQLTMSGNMPDSVLGVAVEPKLLASKSYFWKFNPKETATAAVDLYIMFESMSGRVKLEVPNDVFRMKDRIEFVTLPGKNINHAKSDLFQQALDKLEFAFPAQHLWGNMNPQKAYDEGFFVLDSKGELFHMKMVNGKPFIRNTGISKEISVEYFTMQEVSDKSIYGFVFDKEGGLYTVGDNYELKKFDMPNVDITNSSVMVMANLFYRMVSVISPEGCTYYVLNAEELKQHDTPYRVAAQEDRWDKIAVWAFPVYLTFSSPYSDYYMPHIEVGSYATFILSLILGIACIVTIGRKRKLSRKILDFTIVTLFGLPGAIAVALIK